jgi:hypothetical protein
MLRYYPNPSANNNANRSFVSIFLMYCVSILLHTEPTRFTCMYARAQRISHQTTHTRRFPRTFFSINITIHFRCYSVNSMTDYTSYITKGEHLDKIISEVCTLLSNPRCKKVTKGLLMAYRDNIMSHPKSNLAISLQIERAFDDGTITMSMSDVRTCEKYLPDLALYDITSSEDLVRLYEH